MTVCIPMFTRLVFLMAATLLATSVFAQVPCDDNPSRFLKVLRDKYKEEQVWSGVTHGGAEAMLFQSQDGSWSFLVFRKRHGKEIVCMPMSGKEGELLPSGKPV